MTTKTLVLIACLVAIAPAHATDAIADAKARILETLKDPDSAKFRDVKLYKSGAVCGSYNAKNSYGGYVGYTHFGFTAQGAAILPPNTDLTGDYLRASIDLFHERCEAGRTE